MFLGVLHLLLLLLFLLLPSLERVGDPWLDRWLTDWQIEEVHWAPSQSTEKWLLHSTTSLGGCLLCLRKFGDPRRTWHLETSFFFFLWELRLHISEVAAPGQLPPAQLSQLSSCVCVCCEFFNEYAQRHTSTEKRSKKPTSCHGKSRLRELGEAKGSCMGKQLVLGNGTL